MKTVILASSEGDGRLRIVTPEHEGINYRILHVPDHVTPLDVMRIAASTVFFTPGVFSFAALGYGKIAYPITEAVINKIIAGEDSGQPNEVIEMVMDSLTRNQNGEI